jgi:hypothetical protein
MQGVDERGSAYVNASLVEIQEALMQAMAETTITRTHSTDEDESDRAYAHDEAPHCLSETGDSNASNDNANDTFFFDMPYDSAQPSAEAVNFTTNKHHNASSRLHALDADDQSDENFFDPALMPLPLRIRPRHLRADSTVDR